MFKPYQDGYACGWMVSDILGRKCIHHFGDISGFCSNMLRFVDEQVTIIFLSNMDVTPVTHITRDLAKIVFEEKVSIPVTVGPIEYTMNQAMVGKYVIDKNKQMLEITTKQNELYVTVPKRYGVFYKFKLVPVSHSTSKTIFITEMVNEHLTFYYSSSGQVERLEYKDCYDNKYIAQKRGQTLNKTFT